MRRRPTSLTISGLAAAAEVSIETVRYYQRRGLLHEPTRPPGGVRRYANADVDQLRSSSARRRWDSRSRRSEACLSGDRAADPLKS